MCISEHELNDRVYRLRIYWRDDVDHVQTHLIRLYAVSRRGAMRKATHLVDDFLQKQNGGCFIAGVWLSAEVGSWDVHRLYDNNKPFTPWIDKLPN